MSILSGYGKFKRYVLTDTGYKLCSQWTSSNTVQFDDGNTAQTKLGAINGITDSLTSTSSNIALSAKSGKSLQDQLTSLNTDINNVSNTLLYANCIDNAKALNIVSSQGMYETTTYFIITTVAGKIVHALIVQGYAATDTLTGLPDANIVKLYEDEMYPINGISAITEGASVRTKIAMKIASNSYRSFAMPLRGGGRSRYTAYWAVS